MERIRADVVEGAAELGLKADAADFEQQLQHEIEAERGRVASVRPVDLLEASRAWANGVGTAKQGGSFFAGRLEAMYSCEAARFDGDLIYARDIQLCFEAARMIEANMLSVAATSSPSTGVGENYPAAMGALAREHEMRRHANDGRPTEQTRAIVAAAEEARAKMRRWSGEPDLLDMTAQAIDRQRQAVTLEASAEMARRNYDRGEALDRKVPSTLPARPDEPRSAGAVREQTIHRSYASAKRIDAASDAQQEVAADTAKGRPEGAAALADRQKQVADAIENAQRENAKDEAAAGLMPKDVPSRDDALATIQKGQERLASMPQQLTEIRESSRSRSQAATQAADAHRQAGSAPADQQGAARRLAEQTDRVLAEADDQLAEMVTVVQPEATSALSKELRRFEPETAEACDNIDQKLTPAIEAMRSAARLVNAKGIESGVDEGRLAITAVQESLRKAQAQFLERDPVVAAKWFAKAAAAALAQKPPDFAMARQQQANASDALSRAWNKAVREAAVNRLSGTPGMAAAFSSAPSGGWTGRGRDTRDLTAWREWGQLRAANQSGLNAPIRESDPPEYQEAIKAYFEALNHIDEPGAAK